VRKIRITKSHPKSTAVKPGRALSRTFFPRIPSSGFSKPHLSWVNAILFAGYTYNTFFALLACTGLRVSEAIHLCFQDVTTDGLIIRCSKFRKSRLVPLHVTTQASLEQYLLRRRALRGPHW
jgi:integrase